MAGADFGRPVVHVLDRSIDVGDLAPDPLGDFVVTVGFQAASTLR